MHCPNPYPVSEQVEGFCQASAGFSADFSTVGAGVAFGSSLPAHGSWRSEPVELGDGGRFRTECQR